MKKNIAKKYFICYNNGDSGDIYKEVSYGIFFEKSKVKRKDIHLDL